MISARWKNLPEDKQVQVFTSDVLNWMRVACICVASEWRCLLMMMLVNPRIDASKMKEAMEIMVQEIIKHEEQQVASQGVPQRQRIPTPTHSL